MSRRSSSTPITRTESAIKSHRAVNNIFSNKAAQQRKVVEDRLSGKAWSSAHSGPIHSGLRGLYTPSQLHKLKEEGKFVDAEGNVVEGLPSDSFSQDNKSCYLLNAQKQFHCYGRDDPEMSKIALQNVRFSYADALKEHNKTLAIVRHEKTIPKRRIVDPYVQLTSAQCDLHQDVPTASDIRNRVRQREGWVLANPERQELFKGKPLMSRVIAGEFYYENGDLNALAGDFIAINKKHIRSASAVSRVANARASVSALPDYAAAPQPRRTIATLKTYNATSEQKMMAQRGRACSSHGPAPLSNMNPNNVRTMSTGHRHYLPHGHEITMGGKLARSIIKPPECCHGPSCQHRSAPMTHGLAASSTYVPGMWPPQPSAPSHELAVHRSSARYPRGN